MNVTLKSWAIGVLNAVLSGGAAAVGSIVAGTTLKQGAIIVGLAAAVSLSKWMAQHPIPGGQS